MKRKSAWLSFTACELTAASVALPARAVLHDMTPAKTQVCQVCPLRTGTPASTVSNIASGKRDKAEI